MAFIGSSRLIFMCLAPVTSLITLELLYLAMFYFTSLWLRLVLGILALIPMVTSLTAFHIATFRSSKYHTLKTMLTQYFIEHALSMSGKLIMRKLRRAWKEPRKYQEALLKEILTLHSETEYGHRFRFREVKSLLDFRKRHSLTTFEHYRPYVERMINGESDVLTGEAPTRYALTSGTTGAAKMIPITPTYTKKIYGGIAGLCKEVERKTFCSTSPMQKQIMFYCASISRTTTSGVPMGPLSQVPAWAKKLLAASNATPSVGFDLDNVYQATYVHLLFGLRDRDLCGIFAGFTSTLMSAMRQLEQCWYQIVQDLISGKIDGKLSIPNYIRVELDAELGNGNRVRALELKREFEKGFQGIIQRVWPSMTHIIAIDTSGLRHRLQQTYAEGVTIYSHMIGATEGVIGYNMTPGNDPEVFDLTPTAMVYEFIPEEYMSDTQPQTRFIDELEIGKKYEVVLTTHCALFRYRIGDVIRVVDFRDNCPTVEFAYRLGQMLNVRAEKVDQGNVRKAIEAAIKQWSGVELVDYAVAESNLCNGKQKDGDKVGINPYYIFFLELLGTNVGIRLSSNQKNAIDEELRRVSFTYNSFREKDSIAPPRVNIVNPGTFHKLKDYILMSSTTTPNQYKVPRKLRTIETLNLMLENCS